MSDTLRRVILLNDRKAKSLRLAWLLLLLESISLLQLWSSSCVFFCGWTVKHKYICVCTDDVVVQEH